jgi:hypothetical protein
MEHFSGLGANGKLILSLILKKYGINLRIEFSWLRIGYSAVLNIRSKILYHLSKQVLPNFVMFGFSGSEGQDNDVTVCDVV